MAVSLRHRYERLTSPEHDYNGCRRCGKGRTSVIHRLGGRCSACFRYFKHYELDASRRCDDCRP